MKRKVIIPFLAVGLLCILVVFLFINYLNNLFSQNETGLKGENLVTANDIIKTSQSFLETKNSDKLSNILKQSGFDLILYDEDEYIIFDNKNKANLGKKDDVNKVLSDVDSNKKLFIVNDTAKGKGKFAVAIIDFHQKSLDLDRLKDSITRLVWALCGVVIILLAVVLGFLYFYVLLPFKKLERFAGEVAKGNLDIPLLQYRQNLFGAFTWAFDMMRSELKTSKEREAEAERTKKELVAVLSHDIRTPIASIKAYAECLKSLPEKDSQRGERYIDVIIQKTDEITQLSQDMFMHAISDLEKLEITPQPYQSRELLNNIIEPLILQYENRIVITSVIPEVTVFTDKLRLAQVFENIISNTAKYSPDSGIRIMVSVSGEMLKCSFKDSGKGVLSEDIPFLFDKFFRGKNTKESGQPGSGLGLYISKYILEKTGGKIKASNYCEDGQSGFLIEVCLKIL